MLGRDEARRERHVVVRAYARAPRARVQEVLETLAAQGFIRVGESVEYQLA